MTKKEKTAAIAKLIEIGRIADDIINTCASAIGRILGDDHLGESSKDAIFHLPSDPSPKAYARQLVKESEQQ